MLPRIHLVRHGETEWSLSGRHTGRTDIPLTSHGEDQARQLGELLRKTSFAHVFTSPRLRARRTCEIAGFDSIAQVDEELAEWDYGRYEGLTSEAIRAQHPGWNLYDYGCPQGESPSHASERADQVLDRLRKLDGNVLVFSHGHFSRVLGARWIELPAAAARRFLLGPASLCILSFDHKRVDEPVIDLWNAGAGEIFPE